MVFKTTMLRRNQMLCMNLENKSNNRKKSRVYTTFIQILPAFINIITNT